jgi:hypothetical protein
MEMQYDWHMIRAMLHCTYKAWRLKKAAIHPEFGKGNEGFDPIECKVVSSSTHRISVPLIAISGDDKLAFVAWYKKQEIRQRTCQKIANPVWGWPDYFRWH